MKWHYCFWILWMWYDFLYENQRKPLFHNCVKIFTLIWQNFVMNKHNEWNYCIKYSKTDCVYLPSILRLYEEAWSDSEGFEGERNNIRNTQLDKREQTKDAENSCESLDLEELQKQTAGTESFKRSNLLYDDDVPAPKV